MGIEDHRERVMAFLRILLLLLLLAITASCIDARRFGPPSPGIAERQQEDETWQCWEALIELRSCSGEVILFFLNGETYLGPSCCRAIRVIEKRCWAADALLAVLGFTAQEGDVLRGYCEAAVEAPPLEFTPPPDSSSHDTVN
uniref:EG1L1 n=1 Tax=Phalaenopsis aphrodite subsp. formosana TaxID=308872 RepID=A0A172MB68_PHAAO|nr:EG1L1 [Phalaenopsis aphrodite subsp. formosana]